MPDTVLESITLKYFWRNCKSTFESKLATNCTFRDFLKQHEPQRVKFLLNKQNKNTFINILENIDEDIKKYIKDECDRTIEMSNIEEKIRNLSLSLKNQIGPSLPVEIVQNISGYLGFMDKKSLVAAGGRESSGQGSHDSFNNRCHQGVARTAMGCLSE